jgi:thiamine-monophosphate kinase
MATGDEGSGAALGEFAIIARLAAQFGAQRGEGVTLGIGDDAAVLQAPVGRELVWTVDAQVEGQHFRRDWMSLEDIGWRSFVAAASDLSAMGALPWCALTSVALPASRAEEAMNALSRGQAAAARAVGCPVVGGNLSRAGELSVTTTLLGTTARAVRRDGAQVGDGLWLAGSVGLAGAGLKALFAERSGGPVDEAIAVFRRPPVLVREGQVVGRLAHAAIDISDGLAQDAGHLATASGVALLLDEARLLEHAGENLRRVAESLNEPALTFVLRGGEDYALLAASAEPLDGFTCVGEVVVGAGLWLRRAGDERLRLEPGSALSTKGFDHFASRR